MKILYSPQFNNKKKLEYYFSDNIIKAEEGVYTEVEDGEEILELSNTFYFDISNIEVGKFFKTQYPITQIRIVGEELNIELLNFIKDDAPEEEKFPEWQDVEFEDFEIPEGAEIIQLEELVIPEPEPSPVDKLKAENKELSSKVEDLKKQLEFSDMTNQSMMFEMFEYISML